MTFYVESEFGHYSATVTQMSREDAIHLSEILSRADSQFLREFGLEIESELMEVRN